MTPDIPPAPQPRSLSRRLAQLYIFLMVSAGTAVLGYGLWKWQADDWGRYLFFLGISALASGMKVTLSAGSGTMSMNFLFILIGIESLSLGETLVMGSVGILIQRFFLANRRDVVQSSARRLLALESSNDPRRQILRGKAASSGSDISCCEERLVQDFDAGLLNPRLGRQVRARRHLADKS